MSGSGDAEPAPEWRLSTGTAIGSVRRSEDGTALFVTGYDDTVRRVDAADGAEQWTASGNRLAAVGGDRLYVVASESGNRTDVAARDPQTGLAEWTYAASQRVQRVERFDAGDDGLLVVETGGYDADTVAVIGLHPATGAERWRRERPAAPEGYDAVGDGLVVWDDGVVRALDAGTGDRRWNHVYEGAPGRSAGLAAVEGVRNAVLAGGSNGLVSLAATDGTEQWRLGTDEIGVVERLVAGEHFVYARTTARSKEALVAVEPGGDAAWMSTAEEVSAPCPGDQRVYAGVADGGHEVQAIRPIAANEAWTVAVPDTVHGFARDADAGLLVARCALGAAVAIDTDAGRKRWTFETAKGCDAATVVDGTVLLADGRAGGLGKRELSAVAVPTGDRRWATTVEDYAVADGCVYLATADGLRAVRADATPEPGGDGTGSGTQVFSPDDGAGSTRVYGAAATGGDDGADTAAGTGNDGEAPCIRTSNTEDSTEPRTASDPSFCPECGEPLDRYGSPSFCPDCGGNLDRYR